MLNQSLEQHQNPNKLGRFTGIQPATVGKKNVRHRQNQAKQSRITPGLILILSITTIAYAVQFIETRYFGNAVIEALVVALLLGIAWRNSAGLSSQCIPGVRFAGKQLLEVAIVLLGASLDLSLVVKAGQSLIIAVMLTVTLGLIISFTIGRVIGLNRRLATLIAVGNSICGNSAIAAVAPIISAEPDEIASSIALTAVIGILIVLGMPALIGVLHLGLYQYGVLAGLTVYAIPQVMAATFPLGALSIQIGTLVKLLRVLMLGPVMFLLSIFGRKRLTTNSRIHWYCIMPWFIVGFIMMAYARSQDVIPVVAVEGLRQISLALTVAAMAALGLEANFQSIRKVGISVIATVLLSLLVLIAISASLIHMLNIG